MNLSPDNAVVNRSITRRLTASLIITVLIVSVIAVTAMHRVVSQAAQQSMENRADEMIAYLTGTLGVPLWSVEDETVKAVGKAVSQDESIARLIIKDESGTVIYSMEKEKNGGLINRSAGIFHTQGLIEKRVGDVSVSLTPALYNESNRRLLVFSMLIIVLILIAVAIVTILFIRTALNKPLKSLDEIANRFASGRYDTSGHVIPYLEFQPFGRALAGMAEKIEGQISMIQEAREELQALNTGLELRVRERTAELIAKSAELEQKNRQLTETEQALRDNQDALEERIRERTASLENMNGVLQEEIAERIRVEDTLHLKAVELEEEVAERQVAQENLQEKALLLEEEIDKRQQAQDELERLNDELELRVRERTAELEAKSGELEQKNRELERFNKLFVGRELRMVELKERINVLESQR